MMWLCMQRDLTGLSTIFSLTRGWAGQTERAFFRPDEKAGKAVKASHRARPHPGRGSGADLTRGGFEQTGRGIVADNNRSN